MAADVMDALDAAGGNKTELVERALRKELGLDGGLLYRGESNAVGAEDLAELRERIGKLEDLAHNQGG